MSSSRAGPLRLAVFAGVFVALTAGGIWWAVARAGIEPLHLDALLEVPAGAAALLALCCAAIYVTDVWRYRVLGRAVGAPMSRRAALEASVANFFFSWLTPGAAFGAPATVYVLTRRGVSVDGALVIAFGKSLTGIAVLVLLALVVLVTGLAPPLDTAVLAVAVPGAAVVAGLLLVLLVAAAAPARATRVIARLMAWLMARRWLDGPRPQRLLASSERALLGAIDRLARLRAGGLVPVAGVAVSHLAYLVAFVGVAVVLCRSVGSVRIADAAAVSLLFVAFSYLAPTPGGSGLAEAVALPLFGTILAPEPAVLVALTFRALTFYLQIAVGLVYLLVAGSLGEIARRAAARDS